MAGRNHLESTLIEPADRQAGGEPQGDPPELPALVLLWSRDEPARIGESLLLPPAPGPRVFSIGRALKATDDATIPLSLAQARPGGAIYSGPFAAAHISRQQLLVTPTAGGRLRIEQRGRGALRLDGRRCDAGEVALGGLIEAEHRFLLLYSRRPRAWLRPRDDAPGEHPFGGADPWGIVGESPAAWELRRQAALLAAHDEHVLLLGPSGSGKELLVQAIHGQSKRRERALIARNAATIPETLIDAELFGNLRNYPNAGMPERPGLLGEADGGALFLDEIGELPQRLQAHLLRVMDRGEYQRLGESRLRRADLRVIAATNRDPSQLKHDLLARFPLRLTLPGLDARLEDAPLIARQLLRDLGHRDPAAVAAIVDGDGEPRLTPELAAALATFPYTTHVRELRELLWRALHAGPSERLGLPPGVVTLPRSTTATTAAATAAAAAAAADNDDNDDNEGLESETTHGAASPPLGGTPSPPRALSREQVIAVLARCNGVKEAAWRELGLRNRFQFHRLLKKLEID